MAKTRCPAPAVTIIRPSPRQPQPGGAGGGITQRSASTLRRRRREEDCSWFRARASPSTASDDAEPSCTIEGLISGLTSCAELSSTCCTSGSRYRAVCDWSPRRRVARGVEQKDFSCGGLRTIWVQFKTLTVGQSFWIGRTRPKKFDFRETNFHCKSERCSSAACCALHPPPFHAHRYAKEVNRSLVRDCKCRGNPARTLRPTFLHRKAVGGWLYCARLAAPNRAGGAYTGAL